MSVGVCGDTRGPEKAGRLWVSAATAAVARVRRAPQPNSECWTRGPAPLSLCRRECAGWGREFFLTETKPEKEKLAHFFSLFEAPPPRRPPPPILSPPPPPHAGWFAMPVCEASKKRVSLVTGEAGSKTHARPARSRPRPLPPSPPPPPPPRRRMAACGFAIHAAIGGPARCRGRQPTLTRHPPPPLSGFLGAGKSSLVNCILRQKEGRRVAVIENELGEVGIDSHLGE